MNGIDLIVRQVTGDQPRPDELQAWLATAAHTCLDMEAMGLTRHHRIKTRNAALAEAAAIQRFQSCSWPRLQHGGSGDQLGPVDRCLWRAHLAGDKVPSTARALAKAVDAELQAGDAEMIDLEPLRDCLRAMRTPFPAMPIRVWIVLVDEALLDQSPVRSHRKQGLPVTADEFGELAAPGQGAGALWADFACNPIDLEAEDDDWS